MEAPRHRKKRKFDKAIGAPVNQVPCLRVEVTSESSEARKLSRSESSVTQDLQGFSALEARNPGMFEVLLNFTKKYRLTAALSGPAAIRS